MSVPDPYKVLQVDPEAEDEVIEAAYKRLARKYHPDVSPDPASVERMVRINQAWEMLRDPVRRAAVDRARARATNDTKAGAARPGQSGVGTRRGPRNDTQGSSAGSSDPGAMSFGSPAAQTVSPNWAPGRSTEGSTYDSVQTGAKSAGPPPGNPSGSLITFGRYDGWSLGEIARIDLEYLEWLDRMPIGRAYQAEIDVILRKSGRRVVVVEARRQKGIFRRR